MNHAFDCKKGGLITVRHDKIRDELGDLIAHVFSPSRIRFGPMINSAPMCAIGTKTHQPITFTSSTFGMPIAVIYRFAAFGRDRLILLLMFA